MEFPQPLSRGRLVSRYKRFFADVELDGAGLVTAHCANPGRMLGLLEPGAVCWLSRSDAPSRKLAWTLELIEADGALVGVNTGLANALACEAVAAGRVPELAGYASLRREVRYAVGGRIDLLLEDAPRAPCWVEVKSVTLSRSPGLAEWPDSVSARSTRQMAELAALARDGGRAVLFFLAQRADCGRFAVAGDIDPAFAAALVAAREDGVEVICYGANVTPEGIGVAGPLAPELPV